MRGRLRPSWPICFRAGYAQSVRGASRARLDDDVPLLGKVRLFSLLLRDSYEVLGQRSTAPFSEKLPSD
jgi:hypothetical protein